MKTADLTIGKRYADLGTGRVNRDDDEQVTRNAVPCTVVEILARGMVRVRYRTEGNVQTIGAARLIPLADARAASLRHAAEQESASRRFDERQERLEDARQRILDHLGRAQAQGRAATRLPYDLSPEYALGKEVRAHVDRSGYWTGTRVTLDYIQIADLLDLVAGAGS